MAEQSMTKSVDKLAWLVAEVDLFRPTVVVLVEVTMNWEELKIFKAWAKRELRYEAVGLPGEGASRQRTEEDGGATRTGANGIMFMVDSERGRFNHIEREGGGIPPMTI